jgi:hypothetical protein
MDSAYMFPQAVKNNRDFFKHYEEIKPNTKINLNTCPPGVVAVYDKTIDHPHGHVEIKTFGTAWVSDYKQLKRVSYAGQSIPMMMYIPK